MHTWSGQFTVQTVNEGDVVAVRATTEDLGGHPHVSSARLHLYFSDGEQHVPAVGDVIHVTARTERHHG